MTDHNFYTQRIPHKYVVTVWDDKRKKHWHIDYICACDTANAFALANELFGNLVNTVDDFGYRVAGRLA